MRLSDVRKSQLKCQDDLLGRSNVVSVGIGYKVVAGKTTDDLCLIVGVSRKVSASSLRGVDIVPRDVDGTATDVVQVGVIKADFSKRHVTVQELDLKAKHRPAVPGTSAGHKNITAGTIGCVVRDSQNREVLLSNNHVFADVNAGKMGDQIFQPGPYDGGTSDDELGTLLAFKPIVFEGEAPPGDSPPDMPACPIAGGAAGVANLAARFLRSRYRLKPVCKSALVKSVNYVDSALCLPTVKVSRDIHKIGAPTGIIEGDIDLAIQKCGRTTGYTTGKILQINAIVYVNYGDNRVARFEDQLIAGSMSSGGDSGSAGVDMRKCVFGLLFAGSDQTTIFNRIQRVFEALNVRLS